jgi:pyruvate/2-oxoglutarate dehydrogenase complex dihydrolipoamide dehydrogenase (E3) component
MTLQLLPNDRFNQQLLHQVHPSDWINPTPGDRYDLVVIGAGTAGLVVAAGATGLGIGLKVALVEQHLMGGDCLNFGCVPSKSLIRAARAIADVKNAAEFGMTFPTPIAVDFSVVMERLRRIRAEISHHDSAERFRNLGIDVFLGAAQFSNSETIQVGNAVLKFKKAVIATGARAAVPMIPGLQTSGCLTNETIFSLTALPRRLAVLGGGPIGCELAQAFQQFGSTVTLLHKNSHLLDKEDGDAGAIVAQTFAQEGIQVLLNSQVEKIETGSDGKIIHYKTHQGTDQITVDEILVATGRSPNVQSLNLAAAQVHYSDRSGIQVTDTLQTSNPRIFAAGDVCMNWKFTHAADAAARIVIKNALFSPWGFGKAKLSQLVMPWVTYTDPEVAHVGLSQAAAQAQGLAVEAIVIPLSTVDRAITDSETAGFVKILHRRRSDKIIGATIVARHAGEMINEITLAMVAGKGLNTLSTVIHPYPTQAEGIKKAADTYRRTLLTPRSQQFLKWLARLSG